MMILLKFEFLNSYFCSTKQALSPLKAEALEEDCSLVELKEGYFWALRIK